MSAQGGGKRLPLIDSLRAIAALLIFAYHALFVTGRLSPGDYGWYLNVGVPLFYGISGLLLFRPFAAALVAGTALPSVRSYVRHRIFRIIPAYWLALPVVAVVLERSDQVFSLKGIPTYFGFLQIYSLDSFVGGIGQAWTLCVEVTFYAFLPVWAWLTARVLTRVPDQRARRDVMLAMLLGLVGASLAWKVAAVHSVGDDVSAGLIPLTVLPAALDQFAVGMLIAVAIASPSGAASLGRHRWLPWAGLACAAGSYWLIGEVHGIGPVNAEAMFGWGGLAIAEHELKAAFSAGLLVAALSAGSQVGVASRVFGASLLRRAGEISYGIYLWHLMLLIVFAGVSGMGTQVRWLGGDHGLVPGWAGVAIGLVATVAVSSASWQLLERRLIRRSHRVRG